MSADVREAKQHLRERMWALLESARAAPPGVRGYIPTFTGAVEAAERLAALPLWAAAQVVLVVPDRAQQPVRARALRDGKTLYLAAPRLAEPVPFYHLDPAALPVPAEEAADRQVAAAVAPPIDPHDMLPIDLVVCSSVAVDRNGVRLGKGAGYGDLELALLAEAGALRSGTVIVTTVHDLQLVDDDLPEARHDVRVDLIVTPTRTLRCAPAARPTGLYWDDLDEATIRSIPILAAQATRRPRDRPYSGRSVDEDGDPG